MQNPSSNTLIIHDVQTISNQLLLDKSTIFLQFSFQLDIGNFPPKLGEKDTFWHWEYNRITAIKAALAMDIFFHPKGVLVTL